MRNMGKYFSSGIHETEQGMRGDNPKELGRGRLGNLQLPFQVTVELSSGSHKHYFMYCWNGKVIVNRLMKGFKIVSVKQLPPEVGDGVEEMNKELRKLRSILNPEQFKELQNSVPPVNTPPVDTGVEQVNGSEVILNLLNRK